MLKPLATIKKNEGIQLNGKLNSPIKKNTYNAHIHKITQGFSANLVLQNRIKKIFNIALIQIFQHVLNTTPLYIVYLHLELVVHIFKSIDV